MASIVLSSTSITNGALIPAQFKSTHCGAPNLSPEFHWQLFGIVPSDVEYYELVVEDTTLTGSSSNGYFLHWGATIPSGVHQIPENGAWGGIISISPTDWGSGDHPNGWNGPCATTYNPFYRCRIYAKIYRERWKEYWKEGKPPLGGRFMSEMTFIDTPQNKYESQTYCGEKTCPPGYVLNPENVCERVIRAAAIGGECPQYFTYNPISGYCERVLTELPTLIDCSWKVQNCQNPEKVYYIQYAPGVVPPYPDEVCLFGGNIVFAGTCFKVIQQVLGQLPDYDNITVVANYGVEGCSHCDSCYCFGLCPNLKEEICVNLTNPEELNGERLYNLLGLDGCYKYLGVHTGHTPEFETTIVQSYKQIDCKYCPDCYQFENCTTGERIIIDITKGDVYPTTEDIGNVYEIWSFTGCWIFKGFVPCGDDYKATAIRVDYKCSNCVICLPAYLLTNCADPSDTYRIGWPKTGQQLVEGVAYIFDFLGDKSCYTAQLLIRDCESEPYPLYDYSNVVDTYSDCTICNKACYKITDCTDPQEVYWIDQDLSTYVSHIVQWNDGSTNKCGLVETYICRLETYPEPAAFTLLDCFHTCEECYPPAPVEEEFTIPHRAVQPGRSVPPCDTTSSTSNCDCDEQSC